MNISATSSITSLFPPMREEVAASAQQESRAGRDEAQKSEKDQLQDPAAERELARLKQRDREVRAHELAHLSVGGPYVRGGMSFTYEKGPDGQRYAVGGEVNIDTSKVPNDPHATLRKAETVHRAALAPAEPSPQDRSVAARAAQMASEARAEIAVASSETRKPATSPYQAQEQSNNVIDLYV